MMQQGGIVGRNNIEPWKTFKMRSHRPISGIFSLLVAIAVSSTGCATSTRSATSLADPYNSGVTLEGDFLHLRWLESVMTDTHFSKRSRLGRLIVFVARIDKERPDARVLGIGSDGIGRIAAGSEGSAWLVLPQRTAAILVEGQPLTMDNIRIVRLDQYSRIDLKTREVNRPAA